MISLENRCFVYKLFKSKARFTTDLALIKKVQIVFFLWACIYRRGYLKTLAEIFSTFSIKHVKVDTLIDEEMTILNANYMYIYTMLFNHKLIKNLNIKGIF